MGESPGESEEDVFTWSLSPQFELSEDVMVYARAATGYQPGGPNVALPGMPSSVDSSMLSSYKAGLKSQLADRRVQLEDRTSTRLNSTHSCAHLLSSYYQ